MININNIPNLFKKNNHKIHKKIQMRMNLNNNFKISKRHLNIEKRKSRKLLINQNKKNLRKNQILFKIMYNKNMSLYKKTIKES